LNSIKRINSLSKKNWLKSLRIKALNRFKEISFQTENESPIEKHYLKVNEFNFFDFKNESKIKFSFEGNAEIFDLNKALKQKEKILKELLEFSFNHAKTKEDFFHLAFFDELFLIQVNESTSLNFNVLAKKNHFNFFSCFIIFKEKINSKINFNFNAEKNSVLSNNIIVNSLLGSNSLLNLIQSNDYESTFFSSINALVKENAKTNIFSFDSGSKLCRIKQNLFLINKKAQAFNFNSALLSKKQQYHVNANAFHLAANTYSNILSKIALFNESNAFFEGSIKIPNKSFKSQGFLESKALLLSDNARMNALPKLEIKSNDVIARHASSISFIPETELFYLMSKGIKKNKAEKLIVSSFLEQKGIELKELIKEKLNKVIA